jgi:hypothetical protein
MLACATVLRVISSVSVERTAPGDASEASLPNLGLKNLLRIPRIAPWVGPVENWTNVSSRKDTVESVVTELLSLLHSSPEAKKAQRVYDVGTRRAKFGHTVLQQLH